MNKRTKDWHNRQLSDDPEPTTLKQIAVIAIVVLLVIGFLGWVITWIFNLK